MPRYGESPEFDVACMREWIRQCEHSVRHDVARQLYWTQVKSEFAPLLFAACNGYEKFIVYLQTAYARMHEMDRKATQPPPTGVLVKNCRDLARAFVVATTAE